MEDNLFTRPYHRNAARVDPAETRIFSPLLRVVRGRENGLRCKNSCFLHLAIGPAITQNSARLLSQVGWEKNEQERNRCRLILSKGSSPAAAWHFDEVAGATATDVVAGHVGTLNSVGWNAAGYRGSALDFPAGGSSVSAAASTDFDITEHLTIALWVNPSAFPVTYHRFVSQANYNFRLIRTEAALLRQEGRRLHPIPSRRIDQCERVDPPGRGLGRSGRRSSGRRLEVAR